MVLALRSAAICFISLWIWPLLPPICTTLFARLICSLICWLIRSCLWLRINYLKFAWRREILKFPAILFILKILQKRCSYILSSYIVFISWCLLIVDRELVFTFILKMVLYSCSQINTFHSMPYYSLFHSLAADVVQNGLNDLHELIQCLTSQQDALTVIQVFFFFSSFTFLVLFHSFGSSPEGLHPLSITTLFSIGSYSLCDYSPLHVFSLFFDHFLGNCIIRSRPRDRQQWSSMVLLEVRNL